MRKVVIFWALMLFGVCLTFGACGGDDDEGVVRAVAPRPASSIVLAVLASQPAAPLQLPSRDGIGLPDQGGAPDVPDPIYLSNASFLC